MDIQKKPYLVVPFLFEQSTWGGEYICEKKGWLNRPRLKGKKIGQSYELYGKSLLATTITSSNDPLFSPETTDAIPVSHFAEERPFPLIKFTQAKGNSFQLHIKPDVKGSSWQPKAESWYFLEDGKMTFGIRRGAQMGDYLKTCRVIDDKMKELSNLVLQKKMDVPLAEQAAREFISFQNPWQYVNAHSTKEGDIVDLSRGGIHHSWEEDALNCPQGNIVYEVQQDVMDPVSTMRSFDQGKIKSDGTIRKIQIEDYFKYVDTNEKRNTLILEKNKEGVLFDTPYYSLTSISLIANQEMESETSFHHLFVKEGGIEVIDKDMNTIYVGRGHSCFIPQGIKYSIHPKANSTVLLTFLR